MNRDFLYFGDVLSVNKEWWQGSAPISRTLPHSKALSHWRQVRRNYLLQGGYPRCHLILTPPRGGPPPPGSLSLPGLWDMASPLEAGLKILFQGGYPWYHPNCTPPGEPPSWGPTLQSSFPVTHNLPTASVLFPKCSIIRAALTRARKRIINRDMQI